MSLTSDFVTCQMIGRIGNQMFQIAHGLNQALVHNRQFVAPRLETDVLQYKDNIFRQIDFAIDNTQTISNSVRVESTFHFNKVEPVKERPTVFVGFYQSEKYFRENNNYIKIIFGPTEEFKINCLRKYPFINDNVTVINVRRGDYLTQPENHPVVTKEVYLKCLEQIPNVKNIMIISDDIPWCRENFSSLNAVFCDYWNWEAMWCMSMCKNFVIANSTFSWWGAFLGEKEDSTVVLADTWFGPGVHSRGHYETDIFKENWIKVPSRYESGQILLKA